MKTTDTLGRATFHHIAPHPVKKLPERARLWLAHINRHGPQSSEYLHELTKARYKNRRWTGDNLQRMRSNGVLRLPRQQRATENANFHHFVYDIGPKAEQFVELELEVRPTGHWVHQYMTSCITSSIDIMAQRDGVKFIPAQTILDIKGATLGTEVNGRRMIPDQLFALKVNGKFRAYALEADRGTEPSEASNGRKSLTRSVKDYVEFIGSKQYKDHYGLTAGLLALFVFSNETKMHRFQDIVEKHTNGRCGFILTQHIEDFDYFFKPPTLFSQLYDGPWSRVGYEDFYINS